MSVDQSVPSPDLYGWDWSATTHDARGSDAVVTEVVSGLVGALGGDTLLPGKGLQGWSESIASYDPEGYLLGRVYFGGGRTDVHVVSTSAVADKVRPLVRDAFNARTARVDTRVDTLVDFDALARMAEEAAAGYGSLITAIESREPLGESRGRTLMVGAPSSAVRIRIYEKWKQDDTYAEGTNRVEVQLRPASKVKERVSSWTPAETFCASKVARTLATMLGDDAAPKNTLHVRRPTPDLERTLEAMGEQYGNAVATWLRVSQGDVDTILKHLTRKA